MEDYSKYTHSPAHLAVALHDHSALRRIVTDLPTLPKAGEVTNETDSLQAPVPRSRTTTGGALCRKPCALERSPSPWAKWCRRLPRITAEAGRMRDLYMEITFHFESSVIPFVGRIAPSDTYRIWKRGSNLRADMTLAGFDGFRIQRSDQTRLCLLARWLLMKWRTCLGLTCIGLALMLLRLSWLLSRIGDGWELEG
ncbi:Ankyrin repeat family protein [Raphanus sativus]|nr:Ankyrin repeat family protein [Raphanus sativus]